MDSLEVLCSNPLNLKNKITKIEHKEIFCNLSRIFKNVSWPINIYLKYFVTSTKALLPPPKYLRYYATFKVRKLESFFYKINTCGEIWNNLSREVENLRHNLSYRKLTWQSIKQKFQHWHKVELCKVIHSTILHWKS